MTYSVYTDTRAEAAELQASLEKIREELHKVIIGQEKMLDLLLAALLCDGHVLIEGVPGLAKTLTAKLMSRTLETGFSRIQFTPDLMPSDVSGTSVFNARTADFEFRPGPVFSNIVLIDEINRAPAKTQSALFEAMEERQVTVDGKTYTLNPPFMVIATQNPVEQEGTYRLPEAQLDRFLFKINIAYPTPEEEYLILANHHNMQDQLPINQIRPVLNSEDIVRYQNLVRQVRIDENLMRYIAQVVTRSRQDSAIYLGASPRASIAIMNGAKAFAAMNGRDYVIPEDIMDVAPAVMRHRIILTPEKEMEGQTPEAVVRKLIQSVEIPR